MNASFTKTASDSFSLNLQIEVNAYFCNKTKKANLLFWFKSVVNWILFFGLYFYILKYTHTFVSLIGLFSLMGVIAVVLVMNVAHDASHGACSNKKWVNGLLSFTWDFFGNSSYFWHLKHNVSHHPLTNVVGYDGDIEQSKLIRLSPHAEWKYFHKYQHIYAFLLYSFIGVFIVYFRDFKLLANYQYGNKLLRFHSPWILAGLIFSKVFFFLFMVYIPKLLLGISWDEILFLHFVMLMSLGLVITLLLIPAHTNPEAHFEWPNKDGHIENGFFRHQVESTIDFAANNYLVNWLSGGLNTHVVHHLFPGVCHIHYFPLTKVVKKVAAKHNVKYHNLSFITFIKHHIKFLKSMGNNPKVGICN